MKPSSKIESPQQMRRAWQSGADAAVAGVHLREIPFGSDTPELRMAWIRGYTSRERVGPAAEDTTTGPEGGERPR